jgi:hypothetical protein
VSASGLAMDVDRVFNSQVDKDNVVQNRINFNKITGNRLSAMEHLIPELMFSTAEAPAEGISAVKAIALASAQGQKIWTITQDNLDAALAAINLHADSETEIRNGVNAGNVVTAHEQSINFNGWVGEGYIIVDPQTGAGAYKIAGGGNGGNLDFESPIDMLISLMGEGGDLSKYLGKLLGKGKQMFDFAGNANECGLSFAAIKFFAVMVFSIGIAFLLLPYFTGLGLFVGPMLLVFLRILVIEITISSYFSTEFDCKK